MKKLLAGGLILSALISGAFAGDSAVLVDKGFSRDGKFYIFGQYGRTDKNFQGWAELYTVDVEKNDFVQGGVFKTAPSSKTASLSGKAVYNELEKNASWNVSKYQAEKASADRILYIREEESKKANDEILFQDFTRSIGYEQAFYSVQLVPEYNGKGPSSKSSFFIMVEKKESNGKVIACQKVGSPYIKRTGVTGYKIERIVCDESGRNLVFIIEKQVEDLTGVNIRYMIEACRLSDAFSSKPETSRFNSASYGKPERKPDFRKPGFEKCEESRQNDETRGLPRLSVESDSGRNQRGYDRGFERGNGRDAEWGNGYGVERGSVGESNQGYERISVESAEASGIKGERSVESSSRSEKTVEAAVRDERTSSEPEVKASASETKSEPEQIKEEKVYFDEK